MPDASDGTALLKHIVDNGLSAAELSPEPIEAWAGAPPPATASAPSSLLATGGRDSGPNPEQWPLRLR